MSCKCPATMCPLFAADGSPWTGDKDSDCIGAECGWWHKEHCTGGDAAREQIAELTIGRRPLVLGKKFRVGPSKPTTFDCPRAGVCQWQKESDGLCPPRLALSLGLDPRACAW